MTDTEKFLNAYKRLESTLARLRLTPLEYENALPEHSEEQDKLKTCRIIRNYLAHHPDSSKMFPATREMTEFVTRLAEEEEKKYTTLKDLVTKTMIAGPTTTLKDLTDEFARLAKKRGLKCDGCELAMPYINKEGNAGVLPERFLILSLARGDTMRKRVDEELLTAQHYQFTTAQSNLTGDALEKVRGTVLVVKSETEPLSKSNILGVIWR